MYTMTKQKLNYFNPFSQKPSLSPINCVYSWPGRKLAHLKRLGALVVLLITFCDWPVDVGGYFLSEVYVHVGCPHLARCGENTK